MPSGSLSSWALFTLTSVDRWETPRAGLRPDPVLADGLEPRYGMLSGYRGRLRVMQIQMFNVIVRLLLRLSSHPAAHFQSSKSLA